MSRYRSSQQMKVCQFIHFPDMKDHWERDMSSDFSWFHKVGSGPIGKSPLTLIMGVDNVCPLFQSLFFSFLLWERPQPCLGGPAHNGSCSQRWNHLNVTADTPPSFPFINFISASFGAHTQQIDVACEKSPKSFSFAAFYPCHIDSPTAYEHYLQQEKDLFPFFSISKSMTPG